MIRGKLRMSGGLGALIATAPVAIVPVLNTAAGSGGYASPGGGSGGVPVINTATGTVTTVDASTPVLSDIAAGVPIDLSTPATPAPVAATPAQTFLQTNGVAIGLGLAAIVILGIVFWPKKAGSKSEHKTETTAPAAAAQGA